MSAENPPIILPVVFTIGDAGRRAVEAKLLLYAKLIAPLDNTSNHVHEMVEGETRVLAAELTMAEVKNALCQTEQLSKATVHYDRQVCLHQCICPLHA